MEEESKAGSSRKMFLFPRDAVQQLQQNSENLSNFVILETSHLLYPEPIFSAGGPLDAYDIAWKPLHSADASGRGCLGDTFHPDSYPTHPREDLWMETPTRL